MSEDYRVIVEEQPPNPVYIEEEPGVEVAIETPPEVSVIEIEVAGPEGPEGPRGPGAEQLLFEQPDAALVWGPVEHNFGRYPLVGQFDGAGNPIRGKVVNLSVNELEVHHYVPLSGHLTIK